MSQRYQYQNYQPITSHTALSPMINPTLRNTNYPNLIIQRQQFQNNSNIKYPEMQSNQPIYDGLEANITNYNLPTKQNFNGLQYSSGADVDPIFFGGNDYDNATGAASISATINSRIINTYQPAYVNGSVSRVPSISSHIDRPFTFKPNNALPQTVSLSNYASLPSNNSQFNSVKFENIRKTCFATKTLFTDQDFPPIESSLYTTRKTNFPVTWMRPPDIVNLVNQKNGTNLRPELVVNGYETCDLNQGGLGWLLSSSSYFINVVPGDCWVVAAFAAITCHDFERTNFLSKVIPPGQNFRSAWYTGAFLFRFWRNGEWREVIIDDLLPTRDGQLIYVSSIPPNEFWGALVEKAYAKLNGSYEALDAGQLADALDDFTGGMTEYYSLDYATSGMNQNITLPTDFDDHLIKAFERHSLITAGILNKQNPGSVRTTAGIVMSNGLVAGHAYTISDIRKIKLTDMNNQQSIVTLIRVRNPWGNEIQWNGAWSDSSSEWLSITESDRKIVGLVRKVNGEFWISMKDFLINFDTLDICHIPFNANIRGLQLKHVWYCSSVFGEWKAGVSAGGRPKLVNTHYTNPHYRIELKESPDCAKCNVLIGLLQEDFRGSDVKVAAYGNLSIGFVIYQIKSNSLQTYGNVSFFKNNSYIASVDSFINAREVVKRFTLPHGSYLIVPSTYDANQNGRFLLRMFFESPNSSLVQSTDNVVTLGQADQKIEPQKEIIIRQMFYRESGNDMALTAFQLQRLVNTLLKERGVKYDISIDACKAMVQLFDHGLGRSESSFKLHEEQFSTLWAWLLKCLKHIQAAETFGPTALKSAFDSLQLQVTNQTFLNLFNRFSNESGHVSVSNFITMVAIISKANDFISTQNRSFNVAQILIHFFYRHKVQPESEEYKIVRGRKTMILRQVEQLLEKVFI